MVTIFSLDVWEKTRVAKEMKFTECCCWPGFRKWSISWFEEITIRSIRPFRTKGILMWTWRKIKLFRGITHFKEFWDVIYEGEHVDDGRGVWKFGSENGFWEEVFRSTSGNQEVWNNLLRVCILHARMSEGEGKIWLVKYVITIIASVENFFSSR